MNVRDELQQLSGQVMAGEARATIAKRLDALADSLGPQSVVGHRWDDDGERCTKCGQKDWMAGGCIDEPVQPSDDYDHAAEAARAIGYGESPEIAAAPQLTPVPETHVVTEEMVERACKKYAFREDGAIWPDNYSEYEVRAERVLMREFLTHVLTEQPAAPQAKDGDA